MYYTIVTRVHTVTKINPMDYADFKTRSQVWKSRKKILALTCRDYTSAKTMYVHGSIYSYICRYIYDVFKP